MNSNTLLTMLLQPASLVYGAISSLRVFLYQKGWLKQTKVSATVISIGNITCGGTGKTTIVTDLAAQCKELGYQVGVLSRGYKRKSTEQYLVVSDGTSLTASLEEAGDEPYMIAQNVKDAVVIVGNKRVVTAAMATDAFNCNVLILDDGFQHLSLERDLDIVLVDYNDNLETNHLLPAGRLREPLSQLQRANWVIITKVPTHNYQDGIHFFTNLIKRYAPQAKIAACRYIPIKVIPLNDAAAHFTLDSLSQTKVLAFAGVARPKQFFEQLLELGVHTVATQSFPDHYWYNEASVNLLKKLYKTSHAEIILTTQKDAVKLEGHNLDIPVAYLEIGLEWLEEIPNLISKIAQRAVLTQK